ncbi:hypothetical protein ASF31_09435 [Brevundimonas sp. Leaf280]|uniref:hypothetical protein n=1 Tax=Brevundimonas sp. Leaf280 TaxID=1736320 RepID=UPI0006FF9F1F|nr:hypothetical protein [Brevundimonas sp. Leaf280]KQP45385.1 hypothetical protein ASF31_09435 [Brevundimonas sp. Leaf280]
MARRKSTGAEAGCFGILILIAILAVIGPLALACWCIIAELRALGHRGARSVHEVLTPQEQAELLWADRQLEDADVAVQRTIQSGLAAGLVTRADGMFDERKYAARNLNMVLQDGLLRQSSAMAQREAIYSRLGGRMDAWLNARAGVVGARAGIISFVVAFVIMVAVQDGSLQPAALLFGTGQDAASRLAASLTAIACAVVVLLITRSTARASLAA